jgi:hypothetical protein
MEPQGEPDEDGEYESYIDRYCGGTTRTAAANHAKVRRAVFRDIADVFANDPTTNDGPRRPSQARSRITADSDESA